MVSFAHMQKIGLEGTVGIGALIVCAECHDWCQIVELHNGGFRALLARSSEWGGLCRLVGSLLCTSHLAFL
jgi:hypothetical protein